MPTPSLLHSLSIKGLRDAAWSPDGTEFAVATESGVWMYDALQTREPRRVVPNKRVFMIACHPHKPLLALGDEDLTVRVVDSIDGTTRHRSNVHSGMGITGLSFSPDGCWLASIDSSCVLLSDLQTGKMERLPGEGPGIAWSADGRILAYPTWENNEDGSIELWERETGTVLRFFEVDLLGLETLAYSSTVSLLIAGFASGSLRMWDTVTGAEQQAFQQEDWVGAPTFSPDGSLLALRGSSGTTRIWDTRTRQQCAALQIEAGWVLFCPTGSRLAIVDPEKGIDIWDVA
jgi:WD40 repeat protein